MGVVYTSRAPAFAADVVEIGFDDPHAALFGVGVGSAFDADFGPAYQQA
jgi:hypothetical protein